MKKPSFLHWNATDEPSPLHVDDDPRFESRIFTLGPKRHELEFTEPGACYGFVQSGEARIDEPCFHCELVAGYWFTTASACTVRAIGDCRALVVRRLGYRGISNFGGPIEELGRLRYIDGCTDTLLIYPTIVGDPCLNHLHFPENIDQTEHTHPSLRAGIVARGRGECITPDGVTPLVPGLVFAIPREALHRFRTTTESMDVIAYHPESDWGPTHEDHPMINRTLVGGAKIDNTNGRHAVAEVVAGFRP